MGINGNGNGNGVHESKAGFLRILMADSSLSNPTLVFGLSLWVVAGVGLGAAFVLLLFILSLCFFSNRTLLLTSPSQNPTPQSLSKEILITVNAITPLSLSHSQPDPFPDPAKIDGIERQALLVEPAYSPVTAEVSHLGWGHWYTLRELENATNGFAHGNVIGEGGYGIVYYGVLDDNTEVAVKNLFNNRGQADREFSVEVEAIGRVRHKSLVRLLGYCAEGAQRMLVYEYVNNGNLEQWLHGEVGPCSPLTWDIRMKIILGMAKGLMYLHEGLEPKVVHRDVKSSNILLDRQWNAKVSDFGLAKLLGPDDSFIATRVMGTFGYVAPEYASTGMLTERSDVYSFGILVMEIISGRQPVDHSKPPGEVHLVDWFRAMVANKNPEGVIDPKIQDRPLSRALKRALLVALRCVDPNALKRPKMGQLVHVLEVEEPSSRDDHKPVKNIQNNPIRNSEEGSTENQVKIKGPIPA